MIKDPLRFDIDEEDKELYDKLKKEDIFKDKNRRDQFLFAMSIGFKNRFRIPIKKKLKGGFFRTEDLRQEDRTLVNSVALSVINSIEDLSNREEVYKIAEEYAHGGIKLLIGKIESTQFGTFWKIFEKELHDIYEETIGD